MARKPSSPSRDLSPSLCSMFSEPPMNSTLPRPAIVARRVNLTRRLPLMAVMLRRPCRAPV